MKRFKTISEFHEFRQLPKPNHPLFSLIDVSQPMRIDQYEPMSMSMDFYSIGIKRMPEFKMKYGQQFLDHNDGILSFMAPHQVFSIEVGHEKKERSGWVVYIHPDFLWGTALAKSIKQYDFWDYAVHEALFLSDKEEATINNIIQNILQEYNNNIDKFSKHIIISQIEGLLTYADRFYHRQFITREKSNHQILERLEKLLNDYFNDDNLTIRRLPTVQFVADELHLSSKYLGNLLRVLTGQNTQQHIHDKLIEKAKEKLSTTDLSISEIAFGLGFEHLQSFSSLFKSKTKTTPLEFRRSFQ